MICRIRIGNEDCEFRSVERSYYPAEENWSAEYDGYGFWNGRIVGLNNKECTPLSMESLLEQDRNFIVVGEGDCGKSVAMHDIANLASQKGCAFSIKLRSYRKSPILFNQISEAIRVAKDASQICFVILDGMDENEGIVDALAEYIKQTQSLQVRFILSSRHIDELKKFNETIGGRMYKIAPFTSRDAAHIATDLGVDWCSFSKTAASKLVLRMCAKPELCVQLLRLQKLDRLRTKSAKELFSVLATDLCREHRDGMPEESAFRSDDFTDSQVLDASAWIAVVFSLLKKREISIADTAIGTNDVLLKELITEQYSEHLIRTVMNGRLFEPMSSTSFRIGVEDMIPFLAGKWLAEHMNRDNIQTLLVDRTNSHTGRLYAVLGWVESFIPGISCELMRERPELILITVTSVKKYKIRVLYRALFRRYWQLPHKVRKEQLVNRLQHLKDFGLEPIIQEELNTKDAARIVFAAEVIKECVLARMTPHIIEIILDCSIDVEARELLSYALLRVVNECHDDSVARLKPILTAEINGQLEENIWANVLRCMYPRFVGLEEVLHLMKLPVAANYYGAYAVFTEYILPLSFSNVITKYNASAALDWAAKHIFEDKPIDRLGRLARQIFTFCWRFASYADVRNSIVGCVLSYLNNGKYSMPFLSQKEMREGIPECFNKEDYFRQYDVRLNVFLDVVKSVNPVKMRHQIASLVGSYRDFPLVIEDDFEEVAKILLVNPKDSDLIVELVGDLIPHIDLDKHGKMLNELRALFPKDERFDLNTIRRRKELSMRQVQKWKRQDAERAQKTQSATIKYREWMHVCIRDAIVDRFPSLVYTMDQADGSTGIPPLDIRESVGWSLLDENEQKIMRDIGAQYLRLLNSNNDVDKIAICCALKLSSHRIIDINASEMSEHGLKRLFCILVKNEHYWHGDDETIKIVQELHNRVAGCRSVLVDVLVDQCTKGFLNSLYAFSGLLSSGEAEEIILRLHVNPPRDLYFSRIVKALSQVGDCVNRLVSEMFEWDATDPPKIDQANMLRVAVELSPLLRMKSILRWIRSNEDWGKQWIEAAMYWHEEEGFVKHVLECAPRQIADLLVFLERVYSDSILSQRRRNELAYSPDGVDKAYNLKRCLMYSLVNDENGCGLNVLRRVARILGIKKWNRLEDAKRVQRAVAEKAADADIPPITLSDLKRFLFPKNRDKFLIYTSESLRRFLERVLDKYNQWLHLGSEENVAKLWRRVSKGGSYYWRHKDELSLSDEICAFIEKESQSLSTFREPFVSFYKKGGKKHRGFADLIVHAQDPNGVKVPAEVIIEVKGNWNQEVKTSLRNQLVNRYLKNRGRGSHGIFTCGCYNVKKAVSGYRVKEVAVKNLEAQRKKLRSPWRDRVGIVALDCSFAGWKTRH